MSDIEMSEALFPLGKGHQTVTSIQHVFDAAGYATDNGFPAVVDEVWVAPGHPVETINFGGGLVMPTRPLDDAKARELADIEVHRLTVVPAGLQTSLETAWLGRLGLDVVTTHRELVSDVLGESFCTILGGVALIRGTNKGIKEASDYYDGLRLLGNDLR
jgi:hypothetical protein